MVTKLFKLRSFAYFKNLIATRSNSPLGFNVIAPQLLSIHFRKLFTSLWYFQEEHYHDYSNLIPFTTALKLIEESYDSLDISLGLFSHSFSIACNFLLLLIASFLSFSHQTSSSCHFRLQRSHMNFRWNESFKTAEKWDERSAKKLLLKRFCEGIQGENHSGLIF